MNALKHRKLGDKHVKKQTSTFSSMLLKFRVEAKDRKLGMHFQTFLITGVVGDVLLLLYQRYHLRYHQYLWDPVRQAEGGHGGRGGRGRSLQVL